MLRPVFLSQYNMSPLHVAAAFGHLEIVQLLLERGANKEAKTVVRPSCNCCVT